MKDGEESDARCDRRRYVKSLKSLGRRARAFKRHKLHKLHNRRSRSRLPNDSSCAPIGPDEVRKEKREKRRKPPRGKPDRRSPNECRRRHEASGIGVPVRTRKRSELSSKSVSAVEVEMRARRGFWAPRRRVSEGRMFSPTERPSSSLARSSPVRSRKTGSKTARAGLGMTQDPRRFRREAKSTFRKNKPDEPDDPKEPQNPRPRVPSSVRLTRMRTPLGIDSTRSTNTVGKP